MGVTRQGAQKQLNLLLEQGWVDVQSNPAHRRSVLYVLTAPGLALYQRADALWAAKARELAALQAFAQEAHVATHTLEFMRRELQSTPPSQEVQP